LKKENEQMPYMKDGKCVYKKKEDGSKGKKVGCTKGSVDDYLKALYVNVDEASTKENKTMKMKKSELINIIKEEIIKEMYDGDYDYGMPEDDFSDDPRLHDEYPEIAPAEELAKKALEMAGDHQAAIDMLHNAISSLQGQVDVADDPAMMDEPMMEGVENFTPENLKLVADSLQQMAPLIGAMSLPMIIGAIYEKLKEMGAE